MAETIKVRLAAHRIGFFDPINRVYLSNGLQYEAVIPASADLRVIRAALRSGGLILVAGVLPSEEVEAEQTTADVAEPVQTNEEMPVADTDPVAAPAEKAKGGRKKG